MKFDPISRRHFLQGLGGFSLSLPFLPSLWPRALHAQPFRPKHFFFMDGAHGGVNELNWYGPRLGLSLEIPAGLNEMTLYNAGEEGSGSARRIFPTHKIHYGNLSNFLSTGSPGEPDDGLERLSYIFGNYMLPYINKINLLRGIDVPHSIGHHTGFHLGNFRVMQNGNYRENYSYVPGIDYYIKTSNRFYPNLNGVTVPQINICNDAGSSIAFGPNGDALPPTVTGDNMNTGALFDYIFNGTQGAGDPVGILTVDKVYEDYERLTRGAYGLASRLGREDRNKINQTMDLLHSLQQRIQSTANCGDPERPNPSTGSTSHTNAIRFFDQMTSIVALAFSCGASRIATYANDERNYIVGAGAYNGASGPYHDGVAHQLSNPEKQAIHAAGFRFLIKECFFRLVEKLEGLPGSEGHTLLDDSLCVFDSEHGHITHRRVGALVVTAGSAGGYFNTGRYVDYRNLDNMGWYHPAEPNIPNRPGVLQHQWLGTLAQAMGLLPSEYENADLFGIGGYGQYQEDPTKVRRNGHVAYPQVLKNMSGQPLWIIRSS